MTIVDQARALAMKRRLRGAVTDVVDVRRIERMLAEAKPPTVPSSRERKVVPLPVPRFARTTEHFATKSQVTCSKEEQR